MIHQGEDCTRHFLFPFPSQVTSLSHVHFTMRIPAEDNVPGRFELFLLGDGEKKVTEAADTSFGSQMLSNPGMLMNARGIPSSSIFTFNKEDHTLGNLLRARLLQSPMVTFAAYRVQHPLFRFVHATPSCGRGKRCWSSTRPCVSVTDDCSQHIRTSGSN